MGTRDDNSTGPDDAPAPLPPPAFPPGDRRMVARRRSARVQEDGEVEGHVPGDAFIDPDEPIVRSSDRGAPGEGGEFPESTRTVAETVPISDDAFIDPDEPIVRTREPEKPADFEEVVGRTLEAEEDDEIVVTGIGASPHLDDPTLEGVARYGDEAVADLVEMVDALARSLRSKGEAGLRGQPGMSRFEVTLRAYCVGYLNGRREGTEEDEG